MDAGVIINPISGAGGRADAGTARARLASTLLARHGIRPRVFVTERVGHAGVLAAMLAADGVPLVFAWGGDGTVNEVGTALTGSPASALAIVPAGSGNGLALELGIDLDPARAIGTALTGRDRRIDAGELDGRLFFNVSGTGIDAEVARLFNRRSGGRRGMGPYVTATLRSLLAYRPVEYTVTTANHRFTRRALMIAAANGCQYGRGARIAPSALLDDGLIEVVIVEGRTVPVNLWRARRLFDGSIGSDKGVITLRVAEARIEAATPMLYHVDGEVRQGGTALDLRVHPGVLRVRVPSDRSRRSRKPC
jgi:YegS/Rv2252/BmrU family lipid kinase